MTAQQTHGQGAGRLVWTLLGSGSSAGVPRLDHGWGDCDPAEPRNRRTRCSAMVERFSSQGVTRVLVDTSPDLREQLLREQVGHLDAVLITHDHADQTHGIDDLRPLARAHGGRLPVYMDEATSETLTRRFAYAFEGAGGYPPILDARTEVTHGSSITVSGGGGEVQMTAFYQHHGDILSMGYRAGGVAYSSDTDGFPDNSLEYISNLDTWIIDALRRRPHISHLHLHGALDWIARVKAPAAVLTNMHTDLDYHTLCNELPEHVRPGYDGCRVEADPRRM